MNKINKDNPDSTDKQNKNTHWKWLQMLLRILRWLAPTPGPSPYQRGRGVATNPATEDQPQNLITSPTQSQVSPPQGGSGGTHGECCEECKRTCKRNFWTSVLNAIIKVSTIVLAAFGIQSFGTDD